MIRDFDAILCHLTKNTSPHLPCNPPRPRNPRFNQRGRIAYSCLPETCHDAVTTCHHHKQRNRISPCIYAVYIAFPQIFQKSRIRFRFPVGSPFLILTNKINLGAIAVEAFPGGAAAVNFQNPTSRNCCCAR
jgi:hypothetical protein